MLPMISRSRSAGTSEGIDGLCLGARAHMGPEPITSRDIHVSSDDCFQICCYPRIREEIGSDVRRKINEQIHIAVGTTVASNNRAEDGNMDHASLPKFGFVGAELGEDAGEQGHIVS